MKIGDVVSFQNGFAFKSNQFTSEGSIKVVKIKEIKDGGIRFFDDSAKVILKDFNESKKFMVNRGDVIFALTGDPVSKNNPLSWVGRVAVYMHDEPAILNQRVCKIIPSEQVNGKYLYYHFCCFENFYRLASKATGSASQANISVNTIADERIDLPSKEVQDKVVAILDSITDKIENNNLINKNLVA